MRVSMTSPATAPQALQSLYSDHHRWLRGWLQRRLRCPFDAADLTHDTYARLIGSQRIPRTNESRSWLLQIAKGLLVDLRRRRRVEAAYLQALAILSCQQVAPPPEVHEAALESLVAIDAVLDGMSSRARQAFLLNRLEGLTYPQIAERLNVSVASVQKYMLAAVRICYSTLPQQHAPSR